MKITINGQLVNMHSNKLIECLMEFGATAPFAVAVNGEFLPQSMHSDYLLSEGDSLDLLSPIQGG
ncbi:sulfur carrier protein ThiS [Pseudoalteromonas sp.]|uniref:sulfur carrier protein ThiS n=1 Tax=Pseudoalteromonas sp. TaxID=53249 RepID=UPI0035645FE7